MYNGVRRARSNIINVIWVLLYSITMPLEWLFGKKKTPQEMLRQNQRALNKAMRDLDRERAKMEGQEKKIIADIQKMAKQGQMVRISVNYRFVR